MGSSNFKQSSFNFVSELNDFLFNSGLQNTLLAFLENKPKELSMTENHCLAILEKKERILAESSIMRIR